MGEVLPFDDLVVASDERRGDAEWDDDSDIGELSPASAEQVTMQIRTMVERAWQYIAIAYQGRAYLALGYRTWDEYVDARLSDLRLTVPREERAEAVTTMSHARMSVRAIAKVLGVGVGTVHRKLAGETGAASKQNAPTIQGRDGKTYRRRTKDVAQQCPICGASHPDTPTGCPWDLFAQGLGPRPDAGLHAVDDPAEPIVTAQGRELDPAPSGREDGALAIPAVVQAVTRAVCIVDELDVLSQLVDDIESVGGRSEWSVDEPALTEGVRELIDRLRLQFDAMTEVLDRLERFAERLATHRTGQWGPGRSSPAADARRDSGYSTVAEGSFACADSSAHCVCGPSWCNE
jgi:hypothetical protein